jgi:hypothetical protein
VRIGRLELVNGNPQSASRSVQPAVIASKCDGLSLPLEKIHGCQMQRVQSPHRLWEGLQRSCEHRRGQLDKGDPVQQGTHLVGMRASEIVPVDARPNFIFQEPAGNQRFSPELLGGRLIFGEKMSERNRTIEIDQRSLRSSSSCRLSSRNDMTGLRGGGVGDDSAGGVIQPCRTASASSASASTGLRVFSGGTISATTRSRSVTSTVSPRSAIRTYSLSLFLRTFNPTAFMINRVASCSYQCQARVCWS